MYKQLFKLSKLSNHELVNKLRINHTRRIQFEKTATINVDRFIEFAKKLDINQKEVLELINKTINEKYRNT